MDLYALRVPVEDASRSFRLRQKTVERTFTQLMAVLESARTADPSSAYEQLSGAMTALQRACDHVDACSARELRALERLKHRWALAKSSNGAIQPHELSALVAEHLLVRVGPRACDAVLSDLPPEYAALVDRDVLAEIHDAARAIQEKHDLLPALQWVADNASRLRRLRSCIEFDLRRMEFVELVRARKLAAALEHATTHLAPAAAPAANAGADGDADGASSVPAPDRVRALQAAMSLLAFPDPARCGIPELERLFTPAAWEDLALAFHAASCAAMSTPCASRTRVEALTAAGLAAMHTPSCAASTRKDVDVTEEHAACSGRALAVLPSGHAHSRTHTHTVVHTADAALGASCGPRLGMPNVAPAATPLRTDTQSASSPPQPRPLLLPESDAPACPCCHPYYFAEAARHVPACRRGISRLVCAVSREPMDADNPPLVLPNGRVFADRTVAMLRSEDGSQVLDPTSGEVFPARDIRKAYVL